MTKNAYFGPNLAVFGRKSYFFFIGSKSFRTHISVNQHYLENHSTPFENHENYLEKTWKPTENCENMQKVLIFATHMSPNWISWENDQFWPLTSTCTWHAYPRICILQCIIYIDLNHYDHDDCKRLPSHTGQEQACTRFTRLVVRLFVCHHAENGPIHRKMVVACPLVITSEIKFFFRPNPTRKGEWMVHPVFCIVDTGSCSLCLHQSDLFSTKGGINCWTKKGQL